MSLRHTRRSPFQARYLALLVLAVLLLSASLVFTTRSASAHTTAHMAATSACWDHGCDGKNPDTMGCRGTQVILDQKSSNFMSITLYYSGMCGAAWAYVKFSSPLQSGDLGDAIIRRTSDDRYYGCHYYGDDIVYPGQTSCYSGMVGDYADTAWASGMYNYGSNWVKEMYTQAY